MQKHYAVQAPLAKVSRRAFRSTTPRAPTADPKAFAGRYGDYLEAKVGRVFPGLRP